MAQGHHSTRFQLARGMAMGRVCPKFATPEKQA